MNFVRLLRGAVPEVVSTGGDSTARGVAVACSTAAGVCVVTNTVSEAGAGVGVR